MQEQGRARKKTNLPSGPPTCATAVDDTETEAVLARPNARATRLRLAMMTTKLTLTTRTKMTRTKRTMKKR